MLISKTCYGSAALVAALALSGVAFAQDTSDKLSLDEAKTAASAKFAKLDKDGDGTLEPAEVKGLLGDKAFKAVDTDNDGKIEQAEYSAMVEKQFKRADVDHDGTVGVNELNGPNGRMLKHLIR